MMTPALLRQAVALSRLVTAVEEVAEALQSQLEDLDVPTGRFAAATDKGEAVMTLVDSLSDLRGDAHRMADRLEEDIRTLKTVFAVEP